LEVKNKHRIELIAEYKNDNIIKEIQAEHEELFFSLLDARSTGFKSSRGVESNASLKL
jgi:hypothetical protein